MLLTFITTSITILENRIKYSFTVYSHNCKQMSICMCSTVFSI